STPGAPQRDKSQNPLESPRIQGEITNGMHIKLLLRFLIPGALCLGTALSLRAADPLVVYSHRHYQSDEALFQAFTRETGIPVDVVKAGASELLERLKTEGDRTRADLLITADAGRL